jgi:uncharacterized protein (DUF433 family)
MTQLDGITQEPGMMGGKACIRGMRVTVGMIVGQIGAGQSIDEILVDYPCLEREDILQALRYAAWRAEEREVDIVIARAGKPVARLTQVEAAADEGPRRPGMFPTLVVPDAVFDPLPDEELSFWE